MPTIPPCDFSSGFTFAILPLRSPPPKPQLPGGLETPRCIKVSGFETALNLQVFGWPQCLCWLWRFSLSCKAEIFVFKFVRFIHTTKAHDQTQTRDLSQKPWLTKVRPRSDGQWVRTPPQEHLSTRRIIFSEENSAVSFCRV